MRKDVVDNCCSLPAPPTGHRKTTTIGPTRAQVHIRGRPCSHRMTSKNHEVQLRSALCRH